MKELAELIDYDWTENTDGAVTIVAARRSLVADVNSFDLSTALTFDGDRDIFSDTTNVTNYINSGKLGGYLAVKDDIKNNVLNDLRKLSAAITNDTNILHYEGYGLDNTTNADFFAPLTVYTRDDTTGGSAANVISATINPDPAAAVNRTQLTFDEYDITFINAGADYEVRNHVTGALITTAAYVPAGTTISFDGMEVDFAGAAAVGDSFFISPIMNAIHDFDIITEAAKIAASDAPTIAGDNLSNNIQANEIINKYQDSIANLNSDTYEEFYAGIVTNTGGLGKASKDNLEFEGNLLFELENRRESESGVSLDEEAANLIRYQRAFEASARLIQIADELLEVVINL
jgi:flagellar hook-associated protein 1 FlgK